jgi:hypothetical protein
VKAYDLTGLNPTWMPLGQRVYGEASADQSGYSVSMSTNGMRMAIGAPYNDGDGSNSGHVRVYELKNGFWEQMGADINGIGVTGQFGFSVSMNGNGTVIAVGSPIITSSSGNVKMYQWNGTSWTQMGSTINGEATGDQSGYSVSMSIDGERVAIGAPFNDGTGGNAGHVRVYEWYGIR